jgi:hypothetical protein
MATVVVALVVGLGGAFSAPPRNDYLLVLDRRAGPYGYLEGFVRKGPSAYERALDALGNPTRFRAEHNLCHVTWRQAGITVRFASRPNPCTQRRLSEAAWYGMTLWGSRWRKTRGVHVGQRVAEVRRL